MKCEVYVETQQGSERLAVPVQSYQWASRHQALLQRPGLHIHLCLHYITFIPSCPLSSVVELLYLVLLTQC